MFRRRLQFALTLLAAAAVLQGAMAWWAIDVATNHVQRGRVASDVLGNFLELSAHKQRLRTWVSQAMLDPAADPLLRDRLLTDMASALERIRSLSRQGMASDGVDVQHDAEAQRRLEALDVLDATVQHIRTAANALSPQSANREALTRLGKAFDVSEGRDLRTVLAESIAREQVAVVRERAAADRSLSLVRGLALGATLALGLTAALLSLYFARALRQPLEELRTGAEALQQGDLGHRIAYARHDEFGDVARTMNTMADELARHGRQQADARQRLEALVRERTSELQQALHRTQLHDARRRQLFADISHELRTPTTAIRGEAEIALRGRAKPIDEYQLALGHIAESSKHLGKVIDDLLGLARQDMDALSLQPHPLAALQPLTEALAQTRGMADQRGIRLEVRGDTPADQQLLGDLQRLRQLFLVVLDNAVSYSPDGSTVQIVHGVSASLKGEPVWVVCVRDEGIGIQPDELRQVFQRGFRGEQARGIRPEGHGLGLSIAQDLARAHGGMLDIDSSETGTEVHCVLPLLPAMEGAT
jgi:two-component system, OmpR family, sensor kinase